MADSKLNQILSTTYNLLEQFIASLNSLPPHGTTPPPNSPSPLPLLSTCAATLRAQTTKLSLLIITPPFTPSAVYTILTSINDAILPGLLTATLLLTPSNFTKAYSTEAISLTNATFRDLKTLVQLVDSRSKDGNPKTEPTNSQKSPVTEATGKIWEDCDELKELAYNGIPGFVIKKAEQHLELIKDAVKEIEEWDSEEDDDDDDEDGFFHDGESDPPKPNSESDREPSTNPQNQTNPEIAHTQRESLKILTRIPQSLHVVIHQRLKKGLPPEPTTSHRLVLDRLLTHMEQTSTCVDDVAERLYMHDALGAMLTVEKAKGLVVGIVESVLEGWEDYRPASPPSSSPSFPTGEVVEAEAEAEAEADPDAPPVEENTKPETKEDRYIKRALHWIKSTGLQPDP